MKTLVLYYSFSGKTKKWAQNAQAQADVVEVKEQKKRGMFAAYLMGCPQALQRKHTQIEPIAADLNVYDQIVLAAPVWAGCPAPAFNEMLSLVPKGKTVKIVLTSGSGNSSNSKKGTICIAESLGLHVADYTDIKTSTIS